MAKQLKVSGSEIDNFFNILEENLKSFQNVVLFFTNPSWCPDCQEAEESVLQIFVEELSPEVAQRTVFIEVEVERAPYKAEDAWEKYLYRKHEQIRLKSIPTIIVWNREEKGLQQNRIEEFYNEKKVRQFAQQHLH